MGQHKNSGGEGKICGLDKSWFIGLAGFALSAILYLGTVFVWVGMVSTEIKGLKEDMSAVKVATTQMQRLDQRVYTLEAAWEDFKPLQMEFVRSVERLNYLTEDLKQYQKQCEEAFKNTKR